MPQIIIIAGPNGAGKTSFAEEYYLGTQTEYKFVNADEIARELTSLELTDSVRDMRAGREMLTRIDALVKSNSDFILETTLASLSYARKIPDWQKQGYQVSLIYLRLPSVEHSIERVARRVKNGGHNIPENIIRRRFTKSLEYLGNIYKPIVDEWYIWDNLEDESRPAEFWDDK